MENFATVAYTGLPHDAAEDVPGPGSVENGSARGVDVDDSITRSTTELELPRVDSLVGRKNDLSTEQPVFGRVERFAPWFPQVDPEYHRARGFRSWRIWRSKRHIILWTAFSSSMTVLLANVILVAVLGAKYGITSRGGLIKLYEGDCSRVKLIGTGAHVCINILSTLLLGASNLCMQLLVAPTRREIDVAHRKQIWLDIGIPSWKNLANIEKARKYLFFTLMLSSVPLHFM